MGVTLNKNGKPRKIGSGKTKGAGCFAKIKWKNLKEFIKEDDDILVGRVWLRSVGALNQKKGSKKKLSRSTAPVPSKPNPPLSTPPAPKMAPRVSTKLKKEPPTREHADQDDYDPPPLFASIGEIKKY
jgi:hypothetical protein